MPLSISSSNQRIPAAPYGKLWMVAIFLMFLIMALVELFLRWQGHLKSDLDDSTRWAIEMNAVKKNKADVVLIGASRLQLGFVPSVFETETGRKTENLVIHGGEATAVLKYVANQTAFNGLVLCSLYEYQPFSPEKVSKTNRYIRHYENLFRNGAGYNPMFERKIRSALQRHLVFFSANVTSCIRHKKLSPIYIGVGPDRSRYAFFNEMLSRKRLSQMQSSNEDWMERTLRELNDNGQFLSKWTAVAEELLEARRIVNQRGGEVVFIRYPVSGIVRQKIDKALPREQFWRVLEDVAPTIHYQDYSEMVSMVCPDESHLNHDDAIVMTRLISVILAQKKIKFRQSNF